MRRLDAWWRFDAWLNSIYPVGYWILFAAVVGVGFLVGFAVVALAF